MLSSTEKIYTYKYNDIFSIYIVIYKEVDFSLLSQVLIRNRS